MSRSRVGLTVYRESRMMPASENVIKSGSDIADECNSRSDADDKKNKTAQAVVREPAPRRQIDCQSKEPQINTE